MILHLHSYVDQVAFGQKNFRHRNMLFQGGSEAVVQAERTVWVRAIPAVVHGESLADQLFCELHPVSVVLHVVNHRPCVLPERHKLFEKGPVLATDSLGNVVGLLFDKFLGLLLCFVLAHLELPVVRPLHLPNLLLQFIYALM